MTNEPLGIEVTRSLTNETNTGIVDEMMGRKDEPLSRDIDGSLGYRATVYGVGESAAAAFEDAYRSSKMIAYLNPDLTEVTNIKPSETDTTALPEPEDLSPIEVLLGAEIQGAEEHAPVIQKGVEALESAGFEPYVEVMASYPDRSHKLSAQEVVDEIEDQPVRVTVSSYSNPVNDHPDSHHVVARYHPDNQTLEPDVSVDSPTHGTEEEADEINTEMEEALDEAGLLE